MGHVRRASIGRAVLSVIILAAAFAGCVVEERPAGAPPRPCAGGEWIAGHRGPRGAWHPGHWRCPGVVEVVEVE